MRSIWRAPVSLTGRLAMLLVLGFTVTPALAATTPVRGNLVVTGTASPSPGASNGTVTYAVSVKNDGSLGARGVTVTVQYPSQTAFVKCTPSVSGQVCTAADGVVTTTFATVKAHAVVKVSVALKMPAVTELTTIGVTAHAHADSAIGGEEPRDGDATISGTVLPGTIRVELLPTLRRANIACGVTINASFFQGAEHTVRLIDGMGCPESDIGIRMAASGKTLDLNKLKIVGASSALRQNSKGIVVAEGATNVTITGGSTGGASGIEYFDYCVQDEGGNTGLLIQNLRCFRARSAGFDVASDGVTISGVLTDRVVAAANATQELPGGVGIHASGNTHIVNSIARRSGGIGIWADGTLDPDGDHRIVVIDGNTRVEASAGIGIVLDGQFHTMKDVDVEGDGQDGVSTDGIVINATGVSLDGVQVKEFGGRGMVVTGAGAKVLRSTVEDVGLDSFVVSGALATLNGNSANGGVAGFVVSGADCTLDTNSAEGTAGSAFVITGDRSRLTNNKARTNGGGAFVLGGNAGYYETNKTETNGAAGFLVTGNDGIFKGNSSTKSKTAGFDVRGANNQFQTNVAEKNTGTEWIIAPNNVDKGSNRKNGKTFSFTTAGGSFE